MHARDVPASLQNAPSLLRRPRAAGPVPAGDRSGRGGRAGVLAAAVHGEAVGGEVHAAVRVLHPVSVRPGGPASAAERAAVRGDDEDAADGAAVPRVSVRVHAGGRAGAAAAVDAREGRSDRKYRGVREGGEGGGRERERKGEG